MAWLLLLVRKCFLFFFFWIMKVLPFNCPICKYLLNSFGLSLLLLAPYVWDRKWLSLHGDVSLKLFWLSITSVSVFSLKTFFEVFSSCFVRMELLSLVLGEWMFCQGTQLSKCGACNSELYTVDWSYGSHSYKNFQDPKP